MLLLALTMMTTTTIDGNIVYRRQVGKKIKRKSSPLWILSYVVLILLAACILYGTLRTMIIIKVQTRKCDNNFGHLLKLKLSPFKRQFRTKLAKEQKISI